VRRPESGVADERRKIPSSPRLEGLLVEE